jgi:hypothetical protein
MDKLEKRLLLAYEDAIATRGKNKGKLKAKCPPIGTDAAIMWTQMMLYANPYKVGMMHAIMGAHSDPEFTEACSAFAKERSSVAKYMDRDRVALESLGVW